MIAVNIFQVFVYKVFNFSVVENKKNGEFGKPGNSVFDKLGLI